MGQRYSKEIKAAALADLASGDQPAIVAQRYGLNPATVRSWKLRLETVATPAATPLVSRIATSPRRPSVELEQLSLTELVMSNLRAKLIATQRIAEHATTPEWLNKQNAADVAGLFECLDRSAVGILDRLASAQRPALPGAADGEPDVG